MKVTIFIPTKNAGPNFENVLHAIFNQKEKDFELLIIDSGSTDQTVKIIEKFPKIIFKQIRPEKFGHAQTRNFAVEYSRSEYMVFLSQDAIPHDEYWLSELLAPFTQKKDERLVAVFSKQIPYPGSMSHEKLFYETHFDNKEKIYQKNNRLEDYFFSNVSSCIKREILIKYPFDTNIHFSEDRKFVLDIFEDGYKTLYNPKSKVIHSHNYGPLKTIRRYFDSALSLEMIFYQKFNYFPKQGARYIFKELKHICKTNPLSLPYVLLLNASKITGVLLAKIHRKIPRSLFKILTSTPYFFNQIPEEKKEIIIYSCIVGTYDNVKKTLFTSKINHLLQDTQFVLFTDSIKPGYIKNKNGTWEVRSLEKKYEESNVKTARWHKINSHVLFPDAKYTMWIDGTQIITINMPIKKFFLRYLGKNHIATFKHPKRKSLYTEAKECITLKKDTRKKIIPQILSYKKEGYPLFGNMLVETTCLLRRNTKKIKGCNTLWWKQLDTHSIRDQLSFNYVCWKLGITYSIIPGNRVRSPFFRHVNHNALRHNIYVRMGKIGQLIKKRNEKLYYKIKPFFPDKS